MVRDIDGRQLMLGPRSRGLRFDASIENVHTLSVDETISLDGLTITGIKATHGDLVIKLGPVSKTIRPGSDERIGWGAIGFDVVLGDVRFVNLGDTLLHATQWRSIVGPDVLMVPIGGKAVHNTMDEDDALEAVSIMRPTTVIPCHYNCPGLWSRKLNPADDEYFKREVERVGSRCIIMGEGESLEV
jgi:L-ascorbate metabolism protein UlaG (beta-lactamase superfamily)